MVWTRERFYIGRPASLDVIDTILLEDIDEVVEMDDELEPVQKLPTLAGRSSGLLKEISMQRSADLTSHRQLKISDSNLSTESESLHRSFIAQARLNNVLQIKTAADSLKSGRTYYVSTRCNPNAAESRRALVKQLSVQSKIARRKAEAKSRFQRSQEKVKAVQTSMPFQFIMATLIMAVRPPGGLHFRSPGSKAALGPGPRIFPAPLGRIFFLLPLTVCVWQNFAVNAAEAQVCFQILKRIYRRQILKRIYRPEYMPSTPQRPRSRARPPKAAAVSDPGRRAILTRGPRAQIADELSNAFGAATPVGRQLELLDMAFTIIFTVELLITAYAHWFRCPPPVCTITSNERKLALDGACVGRLTTLDDFCRRARRAFCFAAPAALGRGDKARPSASVEEAALFRRGRRRRGPPGAPAVGPDVRRAGGRAGLVTQAEWSGLGQARLGAAPGGFAPMRLGPCAC